MKIKRYFASDIRQAIRKVREDQGPDAVILSNNKVNGGVEIVAAIDYDETVFTQAFSTPQPGGESPSPMEMESHLDPDPFAGIEVKRDGRAKAVNIEWSQDPALVDMRKELNGLRDMLEKQLSGLAWGEFARKNPHRAAILQRLIQFGLSNEISCQVLRQIQDEPDADKMWHRALAALASRLPTTDYDLVADGGIIALVGPTGVGKTTTVAKLAARYALQHGNRHVALVTIDNYRVGAHEQLRIYGRLLDIPVKVAESIESLREVLSDLSDRRLVLVDTAGMGQRDSNLIKQVQILDKERLNIKTLLVLAATARSSGLEEVYRGFRHFNPDGMILTKIDEATSLGAGLATSIRHDLPIVYYSDGQRVPEDLHIARTHSLVSKGAVIMKKSGLLIEEDVPLLSYGKEVANAGF